MQHPSNMRHTSAIKHHGSHRQSDMTTSVTPKSHMANANLTLFTGWRSRSGSTSSVISPSSPPSPRAPALHHAHNPSRFPHQRCDSASSLNSVGMSPLSGLASMPLALADVSPGSTLDSATLINSLILRRPSLIGLEEERRSCGVEKMVLLEPRPTDCWDSLAERVGAGQRSL